MAPPIILCLVPSHRVRENIDVLHPGSGKTYDFYTESERLVFLGTCSNFVLGTFLCKDSGFLSDIGSPQTFFAKHLWRTNFILSSMVLRVYLLN